MKKTVSFIPSPENGKGLYRVKQTGEICNLPYIGQVVTIANGSVGIQHSAHPNISANGSVAGMKKLGFWNKTDITVRQRGFAYNISKTACSHLLDELCLAIEQHRAHRAELNNGRIRYTFNA